MSAGLRFCSKMLQQRIGKVLVDHGQGRSHLLSQDVAEFFLVSELKVRDFIVSTHVGKHFLRIVGFLILDENQPCFSCLYRFLCRKLTARRLSGFRGKTDQIQNFLSVIQDFPSPFPVSRTPLSELPS